MSGCLRVAYLIAAVLLLLVLPYGEASVLVLLSVAVDLAAAALMLQYATGRRARVVAVAGDFTTMELLRRVVPRLRMRRPARVIEEQVRWRIAAAARRQIRRFPVSGSTK
ncbi:MAG: hypothetical protein JO032_00670 [Alphaproteobacteria bacterium]|nr:hypothetical protein [Alphaproteobacteria bacterium]MBV9551278.1 hypothetical protein [Alphaproteobacteria bacterium]